jgi:hypothetical protein
MFKKYNKGAPVREPTTAPLAAHFDLFELCSLSRVNLAIIKNVTVENTMTISMNRVSGIGNPERAKRNVDRNSVKMNIMDISST